MLKQTTKKSINLQQSPNKQNIIKSQIQQVSIYPPQVIFQDVQNNQHYQINILVRNQSRENQKIRIIGPKSLWFKVKVQEKEKMLAPGLSVKLSVVYHQKLHREDCYEDVMRVCGNSFQHDVPLKALISHPDIVIPSSYQLGPIHPKKQNHLSIPLYNKGHQKGTLTFKQTFGSHTHLKSNKIQIDPQSSANLQLMIKTDVFGSYQDTLTFSNSKQCVIKAVVVEEFVEVVDLRGEGLRIVDMGIVVVGETVEEQFYLVNNTSKQMECLINVFNKNTEPSDISIDKTRHNFIIKQTPLAYSLEMQSHSTQLQHQKQILKPYSKQPNKLTIKKQPTEAQQKYFTDYYMDKIGVEYMEQCCIQNMIVLMGGSVVKVPVKFVAVLPRVKCDVLAVDFGFVKEKDTNCLYVQITNESPKPLPITFANLEFLKIEGPSVLQARTSHSFKITLRLVKPTKLNQIVQFKILQHFDVSIKVIANCTGIIRTRKTKLNLTGTLHWNNSTKQLKTLKSCRGEGERERETFMKRMDTTGDFKMGSKYDRSLVIRKDGLIDEPMVGMDSTKQKFFFKKEQFLQALKSKQPQPLKPLPESTLQKHLTALTLPQLQKIEVSQKEVDFGNIFIGSKISKQITIENKNSKPIIFEMDTRDESALCQTSKEAYKIDGYSRKNVVIYLNSRNLGGYNVAVYYVINRLYSFQLKVMATFNLLNVTLSTKSIQLNFNENEIGFQKRQELFIHNDGNTTLKCMVPKKDNKNFMLNFTQLELRPNSSRKVEVIYRPIEGEDRGQERLDAEKIVLKVVGGGDSVIKCIGTVKQPKVIVKETQIHHSSGFIGVPICGKLVIRNVSKVESVFRVTPSKQMFTNIEIDQQILLLKPEQKRQLPYKLFSTECKQLQGTISLEIRGGKKIVVSLKASFIYPQIVSEYQTLDFGNIPIMGNSYMELMKLTNITKQEIRLEQIEGPTDYFLEIYEVAQNKAFEESSTVSWKMKKNPSGKEDKKKSNGLQPIRNLRLQSLCCKYYEVKFIPKAERQYKMGVPLRLSGTEGVRVEPVKVEVQCCGIEPVAYIKPQKIDFGKKIINENRSWYSSYFQIRNPHSIQIDWRIDDFEDTPSKSNFTFSSREGTIQPNESIKIELNFKPYTEGKFSQRFEVLLKEKKVSRLMLEVEGSALFPTIKFNCNELIMPIVPIGVEAKGYLQFENCGYDAISISRWKLANQFQGVDVRLNFNQGKLLSLAKKTLKVEVTFFSLVVISFTSHLQIYDEYGNRYRLPISATCDSCLFTIYPYLQSQNQHNIIYNQKENLIKLITNKVAYEEDREKTANVFVSCDFIKRWINYELAMNIENFPQCLRSGQRFGKFVNRFCGRELYRGDEDADFYLYCCDMIKALKAQGAYLNNIRPQFLLTYESYCRHLVSKERKFKDEQEFEVVSIQSWTLLFYQMAKLYTLPQITSKMINKLTNQPSQKNINKPVLPKSSLYSPPEVLILTFLNSNLKDESIYNLNDQMKLFEIIQKVLEERFNLCLSSNLLALKISVAIMSPHVFLSLIAKFLHQKLMEFGLAMFITQNDLISLSSKEIMLYLISFITMLYNYSITTNLCFEASIGDKVTKIIEVDNTATKKIKYKVKIIDSEEFKLETTEITILPKAKGDVKLSYNCKSTKDQEARLMLIPLKDDLNNMVTAQPLVFRLYTSIISKINLRKITVEANLYEITTIPLEVELPVEITEVTEFTVSVDESIQGDIIPNFFCFQSMSRNLKNNCDRIEIKFVTLTSEDKHCKVAYKSSVYGEFYYDICVKVAKPPVIRDIRFKHLKVQKPEQVQINIPKQNEYLQNALKYLHDHHVKVDFLKSKKKQNKNQSKYQISVLESPHIHVQSSSAEIARATVEYKQNMVVKLNCNFDKPFDQYCALLMVKNTVMKDVRYYRIVARVLMKPTIVNLTLKTKARQPVTLKVPIKMFPAQLTIQNKIDQFRVTNCEGEIRTPMDLMLSFTPKWIVDTDVCLIVENRQTLEQIVYNVKLMASEPSPIDIVTFEASCNFKKEFNITLKENLDYKGLKLKTDSKRISNLSYTKTYSKSQTISFTINPLKIDEQTSIKLFKEQSDQYYLIQIKITNQQPIILNPIQLTTQKVNKTIEHIIKDIPLKSNTQILFKDEDWIRAVRTFVQMKEYVNLLFKAGKDMEGKKEIGFLHENKEYNCQIFCKAISYKNTASKHEIAVKKPIPKNKKIAVKNNLELLTTQKVENEPNEGQQPEVKEQETKPSQLEATFVPKMQCSNGCYMII